MACFLFRNKYDVEVMFRLLFGYQYGYLNMSNTFITLVNRRAYNCLL